ncbi:MAG: peptidoglycan editing factor PgeF [Gammaproteobacteria bacterium]|nr:peptidoglycan editing factor PgeF [Gammaproteobacteria bacterium]
MSDVVDQVCADWPAPANVVAGCTLRTGGVSTGPYASLNLGAHVGDEAAAVRENRSRFVAALGLPAEPDWISQVHGTAVARDAGPGAEADASVTSIAGKACAVMVADCLPVLFAAADGSEVGAAHAGWRGLASGVLENTVRAFQAPPGDLLAWLGPAISAANFEVGEEVRDAFLAKDPAAIACFTANAASRWQADLYGLARQRLRAAGVHRVYGGGYCTYGDPGRFFSYRRDGRCGRLAAYVFRQP